MLKAIAWKEFRELLPVLVVGLTMQMLSLLLLIRINTSPNIRLGELLQSGGYLLLLFQIMLFTVVIGFWQNRVELNHGTYLFLLHRPVPRAEIVIVKLLTGAGIAFLIGLPLLVITILEFSLGVAARYSHPPLSYTAPLCLGFTVMYLGAYMSSVRPAPWYKSSGLPLVAALGVFIGSLSRLHLVSTATASAVLAVAIVVWVIAILQQAVTRDY
jgi:ABC-type transport system involved in multi-copper enzyme maturation permease subunit